MKRVYPSLAAVLHAAVKGSALPTATIADLVGKPYATLMSELSGQPLHKLGADLVLPLLDATDNDAPLHMLARERGGVFIRVPDPGAGGHPLHEQVVAAVKEFGELMAELGGRLADGSISNEDRRAIAKEGYEAVASITALLRLVEESAR